MKIHVIKLNLQFKLLIFFVLRSLFFFSKGLLLGDFEENYTENVIAIEEMGQSEPEVFVITLERGLQLALTAERRLSSVQSSIIQSEINLELVASEFDWSIFPKVDGGVLGGGSAGTGLTAGLGAEISKKFIHGTRFCFIPSVMKAAKDYQSNLKASITQPLLRGFGSAYTLAPLRAAQYSNRSAIRKLYQTQTNLIYQTVKALYEILKQETLFAIDQEAFERMKKFVVSTKIKERIGMSDALDVYRAEAELKHTEDSLNNSLERLQEAKDNLRDILGLPLDMPLAVDIPVEYFPMVVVEEEAIATALKNRIEIDQARDQVQENKRLERLAELNMRPELNLVLDYTSFSWDEAFTRSWSNKRESKWGIGFISTGDPRNLREEAAYQFSQFATEDAQRNLEQMRDNVILDVKRVLRDLKRANERIQLYEAQIENFRKGFSLARLKFEYGQANNFDLLQAEKSLRLAQGSLINAIIDHRINEFRLIATLGMLLEKPLVCQ